MAKVKRCGDLVYVSDRFNTIECTIQEIKNGIAPKLEKGMRFSTKSGETYRLCQIRSGEFSLIGDTTHNRLVDHIFTHKDNTEDLIATCTKLLGGADSDSIPYLSTDES